MHLETFAHGDSLFHRLDPRAKLAAALGFSLLVASVRSPWPALGGLVLACAAVLAAGLERRELARRLLAVNLFLAFLWLFLPWSPSLGPDGPSLTYQPSGVAMAALITLKANALVLGLVALVSTSPVNEIFHALAHWRVPAKLLHIFFFFYRYLHVLHREWHRLTWALKARGFTPASNRHTYRTYAHLVGMLLVRSFDRAQRVYQAMLCRGFQGTYWLLDHFAWSRRDSLFLAGAGLALAALLALAWGTDPWL